jgi:hypothetical protein
MPAPPSTAIPLLSEDVGGDAEDDSVEMVVNHDYAESSWRDVERSSAL